MDLAFIRTVAFGLTCVHCAASIYTSDKPLFLLVMFDGFRWDYIDEANKHNVKTPNFDQLIDNGVKAKAQNVFPTKSLPNHYSIVTGMYAENHGMVGNLFYDPVVKKEYDSDNCWLHDNSTCDPLWYMNGTMEWPGRPIWTLNEEQSDRHSVFPRKSGVLDWPGGGVPIKGILPTYHKGKVPTRSTEDVIEIIMNWFTKEKPINLGVIRFDNTDLAGHMYGPDSEKLYETIGILDTVVGYLVGNLTEKGLFEKINIVMIGDHGMTKTIDKIYLSDFIPKDQYSYDIFGESPMSIFPKEEEHSNASFVKIYAALKNVTNLELFQKDSDMPASYHYQWNRRIGPILVDSKLGYKVCANSSFCPGQNFSSDHGYSNSEPDMWPFFIAHGPAFQKGYKPTDPLNIVDTYALMCHLLGLVPAKHDGDFYRINHILMTQSQTHLLTIIGYVVAAVCLLIIVVLACVVSCRTRGVMRRHKYKLANSVTLSELETAQSDPVSNKHHKDGHIPLLSSDDDFEDEEIY